MDAPSSLSKPLLRNETTISYAYLGLTRRVKGLALAWISTSPGIASNRPLAGTKFNSTNELGVLPPKAAATRLQLS